MRNVTVHEEAVAEITEAAKYYEARVSGPGLLFLAAVEEGTKEVLANPDAFQLVGEEIRHKSSGGPRTASYMSTSRIEYESLPSLIRNAGPDIGSTGYSRLLESPLFIFE